MGQTREVPPVGASHRLDPVGLPLGLVFRSPAPVLRPPEDVRALVQAVVCAPRAGKTTGQALLRGKNWPAQGA